MTAGASERKDDMHKRVVRGKEIDSCETPCASNRGWAADRTITVNRNAIDKAQPVPSANAADWPDGESYMENARK